jgi:hypothetical protein
LKFLGFRTFQQAKAAVPASQGARYRNHDAHVAKALGRGLAALLQKPSAQGMSITRCVARAASLEGVLPAYWRESGIENSPLRIRAGRFSAYFAVASSP